MNLSHNNRIYILTDQRIANMRSFLVYIYVDFHIEILNYKTTVSDVSIRNKHTSNIYYTYKHIVSPADLRIIFIIHYSVLQSINVF